jgi:hypothetical protein
VKAFTRKLSNDQVTIERSSLVAPSITFLAEDNCWRLDESYVYQHGDHTITVRQGFKFDLASVPRVFWWLIAPFELSITAPLLHDFLYQHRGEPPDDAIQPPRTYTRGQADVLFRDIMEQEGVVTWRRVTAYRCVQLFGWIAWP